MSFVELLDPGRDFHVVTHAELVQRQQLVALHGAEHVPVALALVGHVEAGIHTVVMERLYHVREVRYVDDCGLSAIDDDFAVDFLGTHLRVEDGVGHHLLLLVAHEEVVGEPGTEHPDAVLVVLDDHELPERFHVRGGEGADARVHVVALCVLASKTRGKGGHDRWLGEHELVQVQGGALGRATRAVDIFVSSHVKLLTAERTGLVSGVPRPLVEQLELPQERLQMDPAALVP